MNISANRIFVGSWTDISAPKALRAEMRRIVVSRTTIDATVSDRVT